MSLLRLLPALLIPIPLACSPSSSEAGGEAGEAPPHVVILLADDLGWADVGYHGSEIRTPHLDRLAREGVELDSFYVLQVCSPTRAALLTGRHPMRYGLQERVVRPWADRGLELGERLLPEALKRAGYATHIVGKWHLGSAVLGELPTRRGFDHHYGQYLGKIDYYTRERDGGFDWHRDEAPARDEGHSTQLIRDEAVRIVREHDPGVPLFLYVPFSAPHFPLQAPEEQIAAYAEIEDENRRVYAAMVTGMDQAIGAVLAALEERGMRERTLVLFFSDNGGTTGWGGSNEPLRGEKNTLYEGGLRVPAVISWPGRLPAGTKVTSTLHVVDVYPTLLGLAGLSREEGKPLDGLDWWPSLADGVPLERDVLLLNVAKRGGALRAGRYKFLIDFPARQRRDPAARPLAGIELYDLVTDPGETKNLAEAEAERCLELERIMQGYREAMAPTQGEQAWALPENYPIPEVWGPAGE